jgi:asparagine synthase (glutamine-hydrolysing)
MCGIVGLLDTSASQREDDLRTLVDAMRDTLRHRGPDASGTWVDAPAGIALGHRRLSIVDLSDAGAQPMASASGRWILTYNGELYNAPDLAADLVAAGHRFRGHSDTEVLVEAIASWGLERTLARANGMFAFAVWDRDERALHLARDRVGEKPLFYGWFGSTFVFASELVALRAHPAFDDEIDRTALTEYLRRNCVPAPRSIFEHVRKLPPASVLTIHAASVPGAESPVTYWSVADTYDPARARPDIGDDGAVDELEALLLDAVRIRMRSDVPLGAFLSGGVDSATVVALMHAHSDRAVRTFTIGSTSRAHNEADRAAVIADRLGTRHTELVVTGDDALAAVDRLPVVYDEPFADSSQIPTLLVSELARRDVVVSLSGDGGDEVFGGYERYRWVPSLTDRNRRIPAAWRAAGARAATAVPPRAWEALTAPIPPRWRPQIPATKVAKLASLATLDDPRAMYEVLVSHFADPASVVVGGDDPSVVDPTPWRDDEAVERMMARDTVTYLPDDILVKLDRATMSVSLEGRIPFLDHRVVELMASLPLRTKLRDGTSKWLLRRVLERYVPAEVFAGPKAGFGVPIGAWLRGPLRPWAEDLLATDALARAGYLRPEPIRRLWDEHQSGRYDRAYQLWDVLMFQAWLEAWAR